MAVSLPQLLIILVLVLLLFGAGKLPQVMSQLGQGMKSFKSAIKDSDKDKNSTKNNDNDSSSNL